VRLPPGRGEWILPPEVRAEHFRVTRARVRLFALPHYTPESLDENVAVSNHMLTCAPETFYPDEV